MSKFFHRFKKLQRRERIKVVSLSEDGNCTSIKFNSHVGISCDEFLQEHELVCTVLISRLVQQKYIIQSCLKEQIEEARKRNIPKQGLIKLETGIKVCLYDGYVLQIIDKHQSEIANKLWGKLIEIARESEIIMFGDAWFVIDNKSTMINLRFKMVLIGGGFSAC